MAQTTLDASKPGVLVVNGKKYHGKVFHVQGTELELYPIQALANAVGRRVEAVRVWERQGEIPKPLFRVTGSPHQEQRRWYSRTQIINLHQAFNRFPFTAGRPYMRAAFFALVNRLFDEGEVLNVGEIRVTVQPGVPAPRTTSGTFGTKTVSPSPVSGTQSPGHREVAQVPVAKHPTPPAPARNHVSPRQHDESAIESRRGYPTGTDRNAEEKRSDYRRRPAGHV